MAATAAVMEVDIKPGLTNSMSMDALDALVEKRVSEKLWKFKALGSEATGNGIMTACTMSAPTTAAPSWPSRVKDDKCVIHDLAEAMAAVELKFEDLKYVENNLVKTSRELVLKALQKATRQCVLVFLKKEAPDWLKDKELMMVAVTKKGIWLKHVDKILQGDRDIVMAAIGQNPSSIAYASETLKLDKSVQEASIVKNKKISQKLKIENDLLKITAMVMEDSLEEQEPELEEQEPSPQPTRSAIQVTPEDVLRYLQKRMGPDNGRLHFDHIQKLAAAAAGQAEEARKAEEAADKEIAELKSELLKRTMGKMTKKTETFVSCATDAANKRDGSGLMKGMNRTEYAKALKKSLGDQALEGQNVFHIIAKSNGGADHPDNYLYALGSKFNKSIGAKYDHFNCLLAGQAQTERAVLVSKEMGNRYSDKNKLKNYKFQSSSQTDATIEAEYLIGRGQKLLTGLKYLDSHISPH